MAGREQPPMPSGIRIALTVRELGGEDLPVAVITFTDVLGDTREMHFSEEVLRDLVVDGAVALRQLGRGYRTMPDPWLH